MTQETQVIRQVLQGDIESFRLIVERYERPIVRMIRNIINNRESCEDIARNGGFRLWWIFDCDINISLFVGVISVFF